MTPSPIGVQTPRRNTDKGSDGDKDAGKTDDQAGNKTVSLKALQEERDARKATRDENRTLALENAELRGKFSILERLGKPARDAVGEQPSTIYSPKARAIFTSVIRGPDVSAGRQ